MEHLQKADEKSYTEKVKILAKTKADKKAKSQFSQVYQEVERL